MAKAGLARLTALFAGLFALFFFAPANAASAPPAMIVPGQMNVSATGAFTYTIPIAVPPGTAGMVPALSLDYSSQSGDGIVGLGWALSGLPSISRCPRTLAQDNVHGGVNYDANDRFCLDGQKLVATSGTYGANGTVYHTQIESFTQVVSYGTAGSGPSYFKAWLKSGQTLEFGNTTDSRWLAVGKTTARAWGVDKITDTKGNYLTVTYTNDTTNGQAYPTRIDYTGNATAGLSTYNSVQFSYATRGDIVPSYQAGSLQQTTVILTDVKTYAGSTLVSDYRLAYRAGTALLHSRLTSVTLCDGSGNCLAPTTFGWQGGTGTLSYTTTANGLAQGQTLSAIDLNGDGLTDALVNVGNCGTGGAGYLGTQSGTYNVGNLTAGYYYLPKGTTTLTYYSGALCFINGATAAVGDLTGNGHDDVYVDQTRWYHDIADGLWVPYDVLLPFGNDGSGNLTELGSTGFGTRLTSPNTFSFGDFNGDGRLDAIFNNQVEYGNGDGTFTADTAHTLTATEYVGDFDGDGCSDVLSVNAASSVTYFCNPATASASVPNWSAYTVVTGDFNGDGKTDILTVSSGSAGNEYLSTGTGFSATAFSAPASWGSYQIVTGDWNGDGKTDLALISSTSGTPHLIYLSTGTGFTQAASIANSDTGVTAVVADWNNDGADDIWIKKASGDTELLFSFSPELMTSVSNGIGATTTVTYDRLNKNGALYTKGSGATYPTQDMDGAFYVVSRVDQSNGVGGTYSVTYAYSGAKFDVSRSMPLTPPNWNKLASSGFMGFSTIIATDLQTNVVTTTAYRTDYPYMGMIASQTVTHGSVTLQSIANTYSSTTVGGVLVTTSQTVVSSNDLDGTALPTVTTNYTYDSYGNALTISRSVSDGSSQTTTNTYTNDTTNWILGQITSSNVQSIVGSSNLTRHLSFVHDASSGLITQETVEPSATDNTYLSIAYTYDAYGHRVSATTSTYNNAFGAARTTTASYDSSGEFKTGDCNALNQCETWAYDARFGEATSHTDPNGISANWAYDGFGRVTLETKPDGTKTATSYAYCSGVNGGTAACPTNGAYLAAATPENTAGAQDGPISQPYFDALNRGIASDVQGFDGSWIRLSTIYDSNGRVGQTSRPYFVSGGTPYWTTYTYDDLGRVTQATMPDSSHTTYAYHGLSSSKTNNLGQTTTAVGNAQGLVASVTDALNHATNYAYDAFGDLTTVTDPSGNVIANTYDLRGRKTASSDPDMGSWSYAYDGLGELTSQTDAKSQTTTLSYDLLGRVTQRVETDLTSTWTYGTSAASHNIGQLASTSTNGGYTRTNSFDGYGRPSGVTLTIAGNNYSYTPSYDTSTGRLATLSYPSGLVLSYVYTSLGYLSQEKDNASGTAYWTANARDAEMHLTAQTFGNGVQETQSFYAQTGLLNQVNAGTSNGVASFTYAWDTIGNLTSRADTYEGYTENFCYDALNRLTSYALGANCSGGSAVGYDALGDITSKTGVGTYSYPAAGQARPHAVSSITGTVNGVVNPTYTYDANGNMTAGAGRTISWTSFNMVAQITQGTTTVAFTYDSGHQRITQTIGGSSPSTTTYLYALGAVSEKFIAGSTTTWHDYIYADGEMVAEHFNTGGTSSVLYAV
ncbi:MAG: VCBS repeat-containing protein, partial [Alphaproteobacteria bacterium]|nr:VCBS repeat-containing protein [Alphaproteobacteria bacterium]